MRRFFFSMFLLATLPFLIGAAIAQECTDYRIYDSWIPVPELSEGEVQDSARWGDDHIVFVGTMGTVVLDFSNPTSPRLVASHPEYFANVSVDGDLVALGRSEEVVLFSLPELTQLATVPINAGSSWQAISNDELVVAQNDWIIRYDISTPSAPVHVADIWHGLGFTIGRVAYASGHFLVMYYQRAMRDYGGMLVLGAQDSEKQDILHNQVDVPYFEGKLWPNGAVDHQGLSYIVATTTTADQFLDHPQHGFLAEFSIREDGGVEWGPRLEDFWTVMVDLDAVSAGLFVTWCGSTYSGNYPGWTACDFVALPAMNGLANAEVTGVGEPQSGIVTPLPDAGLVAYGGMIVDLVDGSQGASELGHEIGQGSEIRIHGNLGVSLRSDSGLDYEPPSYMVQIYDLSTTPATRLDSFSESYEYYGALRFDGQNIYLGSNVTPTADWYVMDASNPTVLVAPEPSSVMELADMIPWGSGTLYQQHSGGVYFFNRGTEHELVTSGSVGSLAKVGDHLYITDGTGSDIYDAADLESVSMIARNTEIYGAVADIRGSTLIANLGESLAWFDVSVPGVPDKLGEWACGEKIVGASSTGDRVYVAAESRGILVLDISRPAFPARIGGTVRPSPGGMARNGDQIFIYDWLNVTLPLDCYDPLPTVVSGFRAAWSGDQVAIEWSCNAAESGARFLLYRRIGEGAEVLVGNSPVEEGSLRLEDRPGCIDRVLRYKLMLQDEGADPLVLATALVEPCAGSPAFAGLEAVPNPANPLTSIRFRLERDSHVRLDIYSVDGRQVANLLNESMPAGPQSVKWSGMDKLGRPAASGTYFIRLKTPLDVRTGRLSLIR